MQKNAMKKNREKSQELKKREEIIVEFVKKKNPEHEKEKLRVWKKSLLYKKAEK